MKRLIFVLIFLMPNLVLAQPMTPPAMTPAPKPMAAVMTPAMVPTMAPKPTTSAVVAMMLEMAAPKPSMVVAAQPPKAKPKADRPAEKGQKDPWWKALIGGLLQVIILFASTLLLGLLGLFLRWLQVKTKLDSVEKLEGAFGALVEMAVNYANQKAKTLSDDPDMNAKKLKLATDFVLKQASDLKLPKKTKDWIIARIEAKIPELKAKNGG